MLGSAWGGRPTAIWPAGRRCLVLPISLLAQAPIHDSILTAGPSPPPPLHRYADLQQRHAHVARELEALETSLGRAAKAAAAATRVAAGSSGPGGGQEAAAAAVQQHMELAKVRGAAGGERGRREVRPVQCCVLLPRRCCSCWVLARTPARLWFCEWQPKPCFPCCLTLPLFPHLSISTWRSAHSRSGWLVHTLCPPPLHPPPTHTPRLLRSAWWSAHSSRSGCPGSWRGCSWRGTWCGPATGGRSASARSGR